MPTYVELNAEAVWRAQYVPTVLSALLIAPLRTLYGLGPASIGAPGDNNHLYGRHRSANWARQSIYCTNRSYGTTDARDKRGDQDWYRAVDIGITGQRLYDACKRLDAAVRAGQLPGVAEWFGTFDGKTVVGWFQGRPSSSDSSHLTHGHLGFWNEFANDEATMRKTYEVWTGAGMTPEQEKQVLRTLSNLDRMMTAWLTNAPNVTNVQNSNGTVTDYPNYLHVPIPSTGTFTPEQLAAVAAAAKAGAEAGAPTVDEIADAVVDEQHDRLAE